LDLELFYCHVVQCRAKDNGKLTQSRKLVFENVRVAQHLEECCASA
jgi:hypothetical protein